MISGKTPQDKEILLNNNELENFIVEQLSSDASTISFRESGEKFNCRILKVDRDLDEFVIKVNDKMVTICLTAEIQKTIDKIGLSSQDQQQVNELRSPMPGLILEINVKEGDNVKKNQPLVILEAMKMENVLTSPIEGKIETIKVKAQQTVEKNTVLINFES